jgi:hypothetical protein
VLVVAYMLDCKVRNSKLLRIKKISSGSALAVLILVLAKLKLN